MEYMDSPLLVVAGAGSGKTRVLTAKIAWLLEEAGLSPFALMAVTFTNKAAGEMMERVQRLSGRRAEGITAGTFHAICSRMLRRHGEHLGYEPSFSIYDGGDQKTLIRRVVSDLGLDDQTFSPNMVRNRISRAKNELADPSEPGAFGEDWIAEELSRAYRTYQRELKSRNAMDFDDLLVNAVRLLRQVPEVAERHQERYRYILVDEYQDTNRPQYHLVKMLASRHRGLCVVGDPDQSIYGWRGADIRNILSFEKDWPDARVILLEQNYRSTQTILTAASSVIANNTSRHEKRLWSDLGEGGPVHELVFLNDEEEARGISRIIQAKRRQEERGLGGVALLYRTNAQSRVLERALRGAGLNYTVVGGLRFYERAEIKDALAYLRVLVNPLDTISLTRAMGTPKRGIGDVTVARVLSFLDEWKGDPVEGLEASAPEVGRAASAVASFAGLLQRFRSRVEEPDIASVTRDLLEESGYFDMLRTEGTVEAETRLDNLAELLAGMEEFGAEHGQQSDLSWFLEEVSLLTDVDEWDEEGEAVTLMTLHAAKGLEFPLVFLTGVEEGLFPLARAAEDPEGLEEERRLCYVGMTRAQEELYLTRARRRRRWGGVHDCLPSRFLGEIPPDVLKSVDQFNLVGGGERGRTTRAAGSGRRSWDEAGRVDVMPDYENEDQDAGASFRKGQTVEHATLGRGRVLDVSGRGEHTRLIVAFTRAGTKHLMARYARLKVIE